jgi:two-component system, NarL family, response regulator NreC
MNKLSAVSLSIVAGLALDRCGLRGILEQQSGWRVIAEAENSEQSVLQAARLKPDLAVVCADVSCMDEAVLAVSGLYVIGTRVLVLSKSFPNALLHAAAVGCLFKDAPEADIVQAVQRGLQSKPMLQKSIFRFEAARLTDRQTQVVRLLAGGMTSSQAADELGLNRRTVENHKTQIMEKLGLSNYQDLVLYILRNSIIEL